MNKSLKQDLIENYTLDDIIAMARLHGLELSMSLDEILDAIAAANGVAFKAEMGPGTQMHQEPFYSEMVKTLDLKDIQSLCGSDKKFAKICRENLIWQEWANAHRGPELDQALIKVARNGNTRLVDVFLKAGADIHVDNDKALDVAAARGHLETTQLLLDRGAANIDGALGDAAARGHLETTQLLLDRGANVHANGDYALRWASYNGQYDVVKLLLEHGANPNAWNGEALSFAAVKDHLEIVKLLLNSGADINASTAIARAAQTGNVDLVRFLLDNGAVITPDSLEFAARSGQIYHKVLNLLLDRGADVNQALLFAAKGDDPETVRLLLNRGADIHYDYDKALIIAAKYGSLETVRFLLERGNHFDDIALARAMDWARQYNFSEIMKLLMNHQ